jgi:hypothetical protein
MSKVSTFCIIARIKGIDVSTYFYTSGVRTTYPSGAVEFCISKSKYRQNSGQKTNNDIYKILHRKLRIEKH